MAHSIEQTHWLRAYADEIDRYREELEGRIVQTIYFGGGTPSLMDVALVASIIEKIGSTWTLSDDLEVTLEANPSSVEASRFESFRRAGVNRVSIGIQALNDEDLRALGRLHSVRDAELALDVAKTNFDSVSFDLIYARQHQSLVAWENELNRALQIAADHLSLYQLTVEPGTVFHERLARGRLPGLPDDDLGADFFELTQEMCSSAGFPAYEISNHARPGAESRHNCVYWLSGDWIGIGPGAHGRFTIADTRFATETELQPATWLRRVFEHGSGETNRSQVCGTSWRDELIMMGLRLHAGIDLARLNEPGETIDRERLLMLCQGGLMESQGGRLRLTTAGRPLLNSVLASLLA